MNKNTFKDYICKPHCVFFKEGEKEEMQCHGAVIAQRLIKNQMISLPHAHKDPKKNYLRFKDDDDIIDMVCANCPFEAQDCDFRSSSPPENTIPCGGYILLYLLKSKRLITAKDLMEVAVEKT